ncbi:MAG: M67 family metallopeptidase [Thermodesulfobacteriota bacterium]
MLRISGDAHDKIIEDSKGAYPHECCGVLVGSSGQERTVTKAIEVENLNKERARDRYEIDPAELNRVDREARKEGLDIIGIYHSHPDHPDRPSEFDRKRGQPEYSYVIVSVMGGNETTVKSWIFHDEGEPFEEEEIEVI